MPDRPGPLHDAGGLLLQGGAPARQSGPSGPPVRTVPHLARDPALDLVRVVASFLVVVIPASSTLGFYGFGRHWTVALGSGGTLIGGGASDLLLDDGALTTLDLSAAGVAASSSGAGATILARRDGDSVATQGHGDTLVGGGNATVFTVAGDLVFGGTGTLVVSSNVVGTHGAAFVGGSRAMVVHGAGTAAQPLRRSTTQVVMSQAFLMPASRSRQAVTARSGPDAGRARPNVTPAAVSMA